MEKKFRKTLFIFRRDLRLEDNTGLIFALRSSNLVIPAFIFTPEQIEKNPYRSDHCLKFMMESLYDLETQLSEKGGKLFLFQGTHDEIVKKCLSELHLDAVVVNRDYTPYSIQRDKKLEAICKKEHVPFYAFDDALLHPPEETLKKDGTPYTIFTPYFKNARKHHVSPPVHNQWTNYFHGSIPFAKSTPTQQNLAIENRLIGGRKQALKILNKLSEFNSYSSLKDFPKEAASTHLSPYLKFTVCSPREIYAKICQELCPDHDLIRSLYWRDFFTSITFFFPHVFKGAFQSKFDKIQWSHHKSNFIRWCQGRTGFPVVDAGMREMNETGFMHNRARMITASFLVKDLLIDWRWGEQYFAQTLIDYDPAVNNGNWQWVASTGCDAQPYFRIFNPWTQQKKLDRECLYIKKWVPELREVSPKTIHEWHEEKHHLGFKNYPAPMICHEQAAKKTILAYTQ